MYCAPVLNLVCAGIEVDLVLLSFQFLQGDLRIRSTLGVAPSLPSTPLCTESFSSPAPPSVYFCPETRSLFSCSSCEDDSVVFPPRESRHIALIPFPNPSTRLVSNMLDSTRYFIFLGSSQTRLTHYSLSNTENHFNLVYIYEGSQMRGGEEKMC